MKHKFYFMTLFFLILFLMNTTILSQKKETDKREIKPALLVIDIQNEFLKYMSEDDKKMGMEVINGAISMFHQHNLPIITTPIPREVPSLAPSHLNFRNRLSLKKMIPK
jgi:isochorismate hydrolase